MSETDWHYGPTASDPDPGKRWHADCGGEVLYLDGDICDKCGYQWAEDDEVIEHAELYRGGDMHVLTDAPHVERIYPLADRVAHSLRNGGEVYRRRIVVAEDWERVEYTGQRCSKTDCLTCAREPR